MVPFYLLLITLILYDSWKSVIKFPFPIILVVLTFHILTEILINNTPIDKNDLINLETGKLGSIF